MCLGVCTIVSIVFKKENKYLRGTDCIVIKLLIVET